MKYTWNIRSWVSRNLSYDLRIEFWVSWFYILLKGIETAHGWFLSSSNSWNYQVKYSSQQKVLSGLLNNIFDNSSRRIYVTTNSDSIKQAVLWDEADSGAEVIFSETETGSTMVIWDENDLGNFNGFTVHVPASLSTNEARIKGYINNYKLAGTTYLIKYF